MKTNSACLAFTVVTTLATAGVVTDEARSAEPGVGIVSAASYAHQARLAGGYVAVDYNTYFYTHKPGSTPPMANGTNPNGDQTRSNRPNEQPPTTCTNVRVDNRSGPPSWKQICRTGYF